MPATQRMQADLEAKHAFGTSFTGIHTPEGYILGYGTTTGNNKEGWAPGALFIDTNASEGALVHKNTGTKTTATWVRLATISLGDSSNYWATDNIESAMQQIGLHHTTGTFEVPLSTARLRDGAAFADYSDGTRDMGFTGGNSPDRITCDEVAAGNELTCTFSFPVPQDWDVSGTWSVELLCFSSEAANTGTIDMEAYFVGAADVNNADVCTTAAQTMTAAIAPEVLTFACSAIPSATGAVTLNFTSSGLTTAADANFIFGANVYYTRAFLT